EGAPALGPRLPAPERHQGVADPDDPPAGARPPLLTGSAVRSPAGDRGATAREPRGPRRRARDRRDPPPPAPGLDRGGGGSSRPGTTFTRQRVDAFADHSQSRGSAARARPRPRLSFRHPNWREGASTKNLRRFGGEKSQRPPASSTS